MSRIRVGKPEVSPAASSHVRGVRQGNRRGALKKEAGVIPQKRGARATPRRSTGINPESRNPILPSMPTLTPP
jgi:hypothetical protein